MTRLFLLAAASTALLTACATERTFAPQLDAADRAQLAEVVQRTLEKNKTGQGTNWSNPDSGHLGTVTPTHTYDGTADAPCRNYQVTATIDGNTEVAYGTACRQANGHWELRGRERLADPGGYAYPSYGYGYGYPYYGYGHFGYGYPYYGHGYPYYGYSHYGYGHYGYGYGHRYHH